MYKILIVLFMLTTLATNEIYAQNKDQKEVEQAVENMRKAMIDSDSSALATLADDSLTYGHSSGVVQHKPEFLYSFTSGASDFVTIDLTDQTVQTFGNTAIVRHILSATTNDNGTPGTVTLKIMLVWQKQHGTWKLLARQAVKTS